LYLDHHVDEEPVSSNLGYHSFSWDDLEELNDLEELFLLSSSSSSKNNDIHNPPRLKVALWTSPYKRARQTAEAILSECRGLIDTYRENVLLGEQQFGLFEGVPLDEIREKYPNEMEHFEKMIRFGGRFYARCPLGESRFDVATRVSQIFSQFFYDAQTKGIRDIIVVSHGVTIRAFVMMFMQYTPEWMEVEPNPNNCSIRLLQGKHDHGTIYEGFSEYRPNTPKQSTRNNSSDGGSVASGDDDDSNNNNNNNGTNTNNTDTKNITAAATTAASVDNINSDNEGNSTNSIEK